MITMTRGSESTAPAGGLLVAFELGQRSWKLGLPEGWGSGRASGRFRQAPERR